MQFRKVHNGYLLRLEIGEKIIDSLVRFAKEHGIPYAAVSGLGAVKNTELGFYHLHKREYDRKTFAADVELASLVGNLSWLGETPVAHCHVTIANEQFQAFAGHLFESECSITVELMVEVRETRVDRQFADEVGLNLQQL